MGLYGLTVRFGDLVVFLSPENTSRIYLVSIPALQAVEAGAVCWHCSVHTVVEWGLHGSCWVLRSAFE